MKKANNKKNKELGVLLALLLVVGVGVYTSAKYTGKSEGTDSATAAAFVVKVNQTNLGEAVDLDIKRTQANGSTLVADGKIAPGFGGYFDVVIDPTGSEVALTWTIDNLKLKNGNTELDNIEIDKYEVIANGSSATGYETANTVDVGTVTGDILLKNGAALAEADKKTVRLYYTWTGYVDGNTDADDTKLQGKDISVTGDVTVSQKLS